MFGTARLIQKVAFILIIQIQHLVVIQYGNFKLDIISSSTSVQMLACDSFEWNGETYTERAFIS